ncbi:MAG: carboxylating nicotinate-nucleotide diphosphorylase [Thermoplasmata archaeon]|nr:MAG: carboxylating nicotinate-nucleotide diphosphorylase [Thermoplasmata archaeon]
MDDIDYFLKEDLDDIGDITSDALLEDEKAEGVIIAKEPCVVAGVEEARKVFEKTGANMEIIIEDGIKIRRNTIIAVVSGSAKSILKGERLALNFLGRMSGIATMTRRFVDICIKVNSNASIAATRKTTPGFRRYEKKAVILGGGEPHRMGLYDAILIKDNHIKCVGSVEEAIKRVKQKLSDKPIEIEVENEEDALKAASLGVDVIMLDNIPPNEAKIIAGKIRNIDRDIKIEVSGGINFRNIHEYLPFADRISLGCLTHSVKNIDFSFEIKKIERNI